MTQLEEYRAQMERLQERKQTYERQLEQSDSPKEREALRYKLTTYRSMIRDLKVQIDHLDPPKQRKGRTPKAARPAPKVTFSELEGAHVAWSDVEGRTWEQAEAGDIPALDEARQRETEEWLAEGAQRLTSRQAAYIDAYYNDGLSLAAIAEQYGTTKSTVGRVIKRGLVRMKEWVDAKRLIRDCAGDDGFDWETYLHQVPVLTKRQRQMMLLVLARPPRRHVGLAETLELDPSTVSHTLILAAKTVDRLHTPRARPTSRPQIQWEGADKVSLAVQTGMGLGFCYQYCFRGQRIEGLTRYKYELLRRMRAGQSVDETARELGVNPRAVRMAYYQLRRCARADP